jgi:hypothetical protein
VRLALVALLLVLDLCPEGMPCGCRRPCPEGLAEALRALEAPVDPGLLPAAFCDGGNTGVALAFGGRCLAMAWFPKGDQPPGGEDGPRTGEGLGERDIGMTLGPRRDGLRKGLARL